MKQKIYIAGPITSVPNYLENFKNAEDEIKSITDEYDIVNPSILGDTSWTWSQNMKAVLKHFIECDAVVLLPGWENSRGARVEKELAVILDMRIYTLESFKTHITVF